MPTIVISSTDSPDASVMYGFVPPEYFFPIDGFESVMDENADVSITICPGSSYGL